MQSSTLPAVAPVGLSGRAGLGLSFPRELHFVLALLALVPLAAAWQTHTSGLARASSVGWSLPAPSSAQGTSSTLMPPSSPTGAGAEAFVIGTPESLESVSETTCPEGWDDLGDFRLTAYVLAQEAEFENTPDVEGVCGLEGSWPLGFLFDQGVRLQGSGRARDGRIVHYRGRGCFEVLDCPLTASGRCADSNRTVAVDPSVIPLGSKLLIEGLGPRRAEDVGGGIRGSHIDVYYGDDVTHRQARSLTRSGRVCIQR